MAEITASELGLVIRLRDGQSIVVRTRSRHVAQMIADAWAAG